ncbi:putative phospholipase B-like lamina ancestor [Leptopilina boulardi]|uniref:putative phospholipase B-like lamina ancestor n=1 Tax=Leptopilina boulardi TaxID=63433 RepID=UPI0021F5F579|nr:putative phospholipase B-like lamina ancestor [Leptopilina boulardi]XP_051154547.1 putative phospholipase B-like lamina ancestor [Leptopilina boulardi]
MLKVVGASWLQTRISTYLLIGVAILGIGAIIFGEFGHVEHDGTYAATAFWRQNIHQFEFWGQGNDLSTIPMGAARAYYKSAIPETGWSILEIETSKDYPDEVQAYAAGCLEGSLTWQLIYQHWYNTVRAACAPRSALCVKMRKYLRENSEKAIENAQLLKDEDPYWHLVNLFYRQLRGLEAGWKLAVNKIHQSVEIETEDFLWMAMASDLPDLERAHNGSENLAGSYGMIFLKALQREHFEPLIALVHNTGAPYTKMLRLIKRYKFAYHMSSKKGAELVPSNSVVMTSYPGALSSQDESYIVSGKERELIVAGTPLTISNRKLWNRLSTKEHVMSPATIMAANFLSTNSDNWSNVMTLKNSGTANRQWVIFEPQKNIVRLFEQIPGITESIDYTKKFMEMGFLVCTGVPIIQEIKDYANFELAEAVLRATEVEKHQKNMTTVEDVRKLMRGCRHEVESITDENEDFKCNWNFSEQQLFSYRGDLDDKSRPVGVIDSKIFLSDLDGLDAFEATSGPAFLNFNQAFNWSNSFPNISHVGQPNIFQFDSVSPKWVWI